MCRNLLCGELMNFRVDTLGKSTYLPSLDRNFGSLVLGRCSVWRIESSEEIHKFNEWQIFPKSRQATILVRGCGLFRPFCGEEGPDSNQAVHALLRELPISRSLTVLKLIPLSMAL